MKICFYFIICLTIIFCHQATFAQSKIATDHDSIGQQEHNISVPTDTAAETRTTKKVMQTTIEKTTIDTLVKGIDTTTAPVLVQLNPENFIINRLLLKNKFINSKSKAIPYNQKPHHPSGKEFLFYSLTIVLLILAIFKTVFNAYFKNLFRVYFNTSLRQTQLADQLEQAKLPSFILNIFFTITTGIFIWLLFKHYQEPRFISSKMLLPVCIMSVAALYFIKFCLLKFMGWISDIHETTNSYIFAIFLVNKIIGIILVPIIILLAFLKTEWLPVVTNISIMVLGLFFLSRYIKSYGAIDRKFSLNWFHFLIYIIGAEIIPLLLIYKIAIDYLI